MTTISRIIIICVLAGLGYAVYASYPGPCAQPIKYTIGSVDPRFELSESEFLELAKSTEAVWEARFNKNFFEYDPESRFKLNLVFDERQRRTIEEKSTRENISTQQQEYRNRLEKYQNDVEAQKQANADYEAATVAYQERLDKYNQDVAYWNRNGGAPTNEYNRLQQEKLALQREAARLESVRQSLNQLVFDLNNEATQINALARSLNIDVNLYNGKFGTTREFDQGTYSRQGINIYQFNTLEDLKLVLAHEYGHALGADHTNDPASIMYYLMGDQNIENLQLAQDDINAVKKSCRID
jgi:Zn-dependent peptidase ImmA (M78 family)